MIPSVKRIALSHKVPDFLYEELEAPVDFMVSSKGLTMYCQPNNYEQKCQELTEVRFHMAALKKKLAQQQKSLEALREEKERLSVILRSISEGVITTDMNGRIVYLNAAAERLIDCPKEQATGRLLSGIIHITHEEGGARNLETLLDTSLSTGKVIELSSASTLVSCDGKTRIVSSSVSPLHDKKGGIWGVVLVLRDCSEKWALQNELFKVQKLESLGLLAGGIAHDFNNILTAILANISLAKCLIPPDNAACTRLTQAEMASDRAADLARQLLTFAKGGKPMKKTIAPAKLLIEAANFALHGANVSCDFFLQNDIWAIEADPGQINQVINNLVVNAVQAMPEGGAISICAENVLLSGEQPVPLESGSYVKISVEDSGIGIPDEIRQKIFDPYFTTKPYGNGLGLTTTYSIIRNHGGHITVSSTPGSGTTFMVYLPASSNSPCGVMLEEKVMTSANGKILVMDDDEMIRKVSSEMLLHMGYQAVSCDCGEEAITHYREAMTSGEPFHAVIMDLTIPGGMGGKEALRHFLDMDPEVKAIVSSGYSECHTLGEFQENGFRGVLAKPYSIQEMQRVIQETISGSSAL
jgi:PAS domain S-box-containing protein